MSTAVNIKKAGADSDPGKSKFFGDPAVPYEWADKFYENVIFFCQIKLSDIEGFDKENRLPHTGYLYVFLDTEKYPYTPIVHYYDGEPYAVLDGFNGEVPGFTHLTQAWEMEFCDAEDGADGNKLFGVPCDWNYEKDPPPLLLQFDPLSENTGFMEETDGYMYLFFGKDGGLDDVTLHIENS